MHSYLVVWLDKADGNIKATFVAKNGSKSSEFVVNSQPVVTPTTDRHWPVVSRCGMDFVVAWIQTDSAPGGAQTRIILRRISATTGTPVDPEKVISIDNIDVDDPPGITMTMDGGVVVVWTTTTREARIRARVFSSRLQPLIPEFTVNQVDGLHERPIVTRIISGNLVFVWRSEPIGLSAGTLRFRLFDSMGTAITNELTPNLRGFQGAKSLIATADGGFAIAFISHGIPSSVGKAQTSVTVKSFDASGNEIVGRSYSSYSGTWYVNSWPHLAHWKNNELLVCWVQDSSDTLTSTPTIQLRRIILDKAIAVGRELQVNSTLVGDRFLCRMATIVDGVNSTALLVWVDRSGVVGDTSYDAIVGNLILNRSFESV